MEQLTMEDIDVCIASVKGKTPQTLYECYIAPKQCKASLPTTRYSMNIESFLSVSKNRETEQKEVQLSTSMPEIPFLKTSRFQSMRKIGFTRRTRVCSVYSRRSTKKNTIIDSRKSNKQSQLVFGNKISEEEKNKNADLTEYLRPPGTWIECVQCKKWRFVGEIHDPSEVCEAWHCGLQPRWLRGKDANLENQNSQTIEACMEPEDFDLVKEPYFFNKFTAGSIVWAKMRGYPSWPAMVDFNSDGIFAQYDPETQVATHYNVVFLDPHQMTTCQLPAGSLRRYCPDLSSEYLKCSTVEGHKNRLMLAIEEANDAIKLSIEERINVYGYPHAETVMRRSSHEHPIDKERRKLSMNTSKRKFIHKNRSRRNFSSKIPPQKTAFFGVEHDEVIQIGVSSDETGKNDPLDEIINSVISHCSSMDKNAFFSKYSACLNGSNRTFFKKRVPIRPLKRNVMKIRKKTSRCELNSENNHSNHQNVEISSPCFENSVTFSEKPPENFHSVEASKQLSIAQYINIQNITGLKRITVMPDLLAVINKDKLPIETKSFQIGNIIAKMAFHLQLNTRTLNNNIE